MDLKKLVIVLVLSQLAGCAFCSDHEYVCAGVAATAISAAVLATGGRHHATQGGGCVIGIGNGPSGPQCTE